MTETELTFQSSIKATLLICLLLIHLFMHVYSHYCYSCHLPISPSITPPALHYIIRSSLAAFCLLKDLIFSCLWFACDTRHYIIDWLRTCIVRSRQTSPMNSLSSCYRLFCSGVKITAHCDDLFKVRLSKFSNILTDLLSLACGTTATVTIQTFPNIFDPVHFLLCMNCLDV